MEFIGAMLGPIRPRHHPEAVECEHSKVCEQHLLERSLAIDQSTAFVYGGTKLCLPFVTLSLPSSGLSLAYVMKNYPDTG